MPKQPSASQAGTPFEVHEWGFVNTLMAVLAAEALDGNILHLVAGRD